MVLASSFRPSPDTYLVALAWVRAEAKFHEECLVIPSEELHAIAQPKVSHGHFEFDWHPGSTANGHLNAYRTKVTAMRGVVSGLVSEPRIE
jgi:hypothetical protein